jgi:hypothetical protein
VDAGSGTHRQDLVERGISLADALRREGYESRAALLENILAHYQASAASPAPSGQAQTSELRELIWWAADNGLHERRVVAAGHALDGLLAEVARLERAWDEERQRGHRLDETIFDLGEKVARLEQKRDEYRIEADCALRDCDAMEIERGLAEERADAAEARAEQLAAELRGMLLLDSYRPRDGSVNPEWEAEILRGARAALAGLEGGQDG